MKSSTVLLVALVVVVLLSCAAQPQKMSAGVASAGAGVAGMDTDLDSIIVTAPKIKPHADATGQAYADTIQSSAGDAKAKVGPINANLKTANDQIATLQRQNAELKADASSGTHKVLGACIVFGVLILTGGIISIPYTGTLSRYIIIGGLVMAVASASLSMAVAAIAIILPWFLGTLAVIVVVVIAIDLIVNRKALFSEQAVHAATKAALTTAHAAVAEVVSDTAMSVQPTVPFTPPTQAIVQQVSGITAAAPVVALPGPITYKAALAAIAPAAA